jgi:hypothetical protein
MPVKQISVSLENVPGKLSEVSEYLGQNGINIIGLSISDTADISAFRFIANDPEKAINVLRSHGYPIKTTDVLAVETPNHPGGLNAILKPLKEVSVNVSYLYACLGTGDRTVLIVGVDKMDEAIQVLRKNWVHMFNEELYTF